MVVIYGLKVLLKLEGCASWHIQIMLRMWSVCVIVECFGRFALILGCMLFFEVWFKELRVYRWQI